MRNAQYCLVGTSVWKVMTATPRDKDAWLKALVKILGERCRTEVILIYFLNDTCIHLVICRYLCIVFQWIVFNNMKYENYFIKLCLRSLLIELEVWY